MRIVCATVALALLAGCASLSGDGAAVLWRVPVDAPVPAGLAPVARPCVADGLVVVGGQDGFVHWLRLADGHELRRRALGAPVEVGAVRTGSHWLVADESGRVHALDDAGRDRVILTEAAPVVGLACHADACLLVTADGRVRAFSAAGSTQWIWADPKGAGLITRILARPVFAAGRWIVALPSGDLVALDARNGLPLWRAPLADNRGVVRISELKALVGMPARAPSGVWFAPVAGGPLARIADADGRIVQRRAIPARADVLVAEGRVWLGGEDGALYALDAATGRTIWRRALGRAPLVGLVPAREGVWAVDAKGGVALVDGSGKVRARLALPAGVVAPPAGDGGGGLVVLDRLGGLARIVAR